MLIFTILSVLNLVFLVCVLISLSESGRNMDDVMSTTSNIRSTVDKIERELESIKNRLDKLATKEAVSNLSSEIPSVEGISRQLKKITDRLGITTEW